jgi:hypothetical protein
VSNGYACVSLYHAAIPPNMDRLPLELKQIICASLEPRHLKSLRLTSKQFIDLAAPFFITRVFLLNHPESCRELEAISTHPTIGKHVTSLVFDPKCLRWYSDF